VSGKLMVKFNHAKRVAAKLEAGIAHEVEVGAKAVERDARDAAPVLTGKLRDSIEAKERGPLDWRIEIGVRYGPFVEFGTRRMHAQPFLVPALEREAKEFVARVAAIEKGMTL
jgi:HK97 gp10 family phage protein